MMKIIVFLFIIFTSATSLCPNFLCKFCPFSQTDSFYLQNFKLQKTQNTSQICVQKQIFSNNRKIFIKNASNNSNFTISGYYDSIYLTIGDAFLTETNISSNVIFNFLDITLEEGDHQITDNDLLFKYSEFFRRIMINLTISSENFNSPSRIIVKTNKLFIFISANFLLENLIFIGNYDINFQNFKKSDNYGFFN